MSLLICIICSTHLYIVTYTIHRGEYRKLLFHHYVYRVSREYMNIILSYDLTMCTVYYLRETLCIPFQIIILAAGSLEIASVSKKFPYNAVRFLKQYTYVYKRSLGYTTDYMNILYIVATDYMNILCIHIICGYSMSACIRPRSQHRIISVQLY